MSPMMEEFGLRIHRLLRDRGSFPTDSADPRTIFIKTGKLIAEMVRDRGDLWLNVYYFHDTQGAMVIYREKNGVAGDHWDADHFREPIEDLRRMQLLDDLAAV